MNLEIKIDEPGTLSNRMPSEIRDKIVSLKISGSIDRKDLGNVLKCAILGANMTKMIIIQLI